MRLSVAMVLLCLLCSAGSSMARQAEQPLHFAGKPWVAEVENPLGSLIRADGDQLLLQADRGLTIWLTTPLRPPYEITYQRQILHENAAALRISDMNQFWAAQLESTGSGFPFRHSGSFSGYDDIDLFYFGIGGNNNRTSRFRHYDGHGRRQLLGEYLDAAHLLQAGHVYHIRTVVLLHATRVYIDGRCWFQSTDQTMPSGYFGLRLTGSSQRISHFQVRTLH